MYLNLFSSKVIIQLWNTCLLFTFKQINWSPTKWKWPCWKPIQLIFWYVSSGKSYDFTSTLFNKHALLGTDWWCFCKKVCLLRLGKNASIFFFFHMIKTTRKLENCEKSIRHFGGNVQLCIWKLILLKFQSTICIWLLQ